MDDQKTIFWWETDKMKIFSILLGEFLRLISETFLMTTSMFSKKEGYTHTNKAKV
jgi:hypothetical protein